MTLLVVIFLLGMLVGASLPNSWQNHPPLWLLLGSAVLLVLSAALDFIRPSRS